MLAQSLITIVIIVVIVWIGMKFIVRPYLNRHEIKLESLIKKREELVVKRNELEAKKEEVDVTSTLLLIEQQIKQCDKDIADTERMRKKKK